jgi:hypothetical protein
MRREKEPIAVDLGELDEVDMEGYLSMSLQVLGRHTRVNPYILSR